jgi:hypothetical protein
MSKFILVIFGLLVFNASFAQRNVIKWHKPVNDGKGFTENFTEFRGYSDRSSGIVYFLANNDNSLYIRLYSSEEVIQRKLFRLGLTLELRIPEFSERTSRIVFPADTQNPPVNSRPGQVQDIGSLRQAYSSRTSQFFTEGFERTNGQLTLKRAGGLASRITSDSAGVSYEIVIPLSELFGTNASLQDINRLEIELIAMIDAFPRPKGDKSGDMMFPPTDRRGYPPGRRPGDGMYPGGSMGGMPTGGPRYEPSEGNFDLLFKKQRIKRKFRLAKGE